MAQGGNAAHLRVLVVTPFGTSGVTGGAEKWLASMLTHAADIEWRVLLLQPGPFRTELQQAGIEVELHPTGASGFAVMGAALRTAALVRRWRPDVVVGNGVKAQLVAVLAPSLRRPPTAWVKHDYSFDRTLTRPLGRISRTVITTAAEVGWAVKRSDVVVIHPPAQPRRPRTREAARRRLDHFGVSLDERPTLVMAGRIVAYKGVDDAIAALSMPGGELWRLVVVGDEDRSGQGERDRLTQLARDLGVSTRVQFVAPIQDLADLFAGFDALAVLTKRAGRRSPGREGFGMTAFEAMQAGIPVVAVAGSPVARRLAGVSGITVAPGAPDQVAAALTRLADPGSRQAMGRAGRDLVRGFPDAEEAARSFAAVLADTAQGKSRARQRRRPRVGRRSFGTRPHGPSRSR